MLVFGDNGYPVIVFPTSHGRYYEAKDFGLIEAASEQIKSGKIKVYCPDGIDSSSWYNYSIPPNDRVKNYLAYEQSILNDVIEFAKYESEFSKVGLAGCGFGGYHALNIAMKYPDKISHMFSISGSFDIKPFILGFYDDSCYFNNPPDYLPGLEDQHYLENIQKIGIVLAAGENDINFGENKNMSEILFRKGVEHWFDVIPGGAPDWSMWRKIFPKYLNLIG